MKSTYKKIANKYNYKIDKLKDCKTIKNTSNWPIFIGMLRMLLINGKYRTKK